MKFRSMNLFLGSFLIILTACNGGGGAGGSGGGSSSVISGVAAIGAPLGNAKLTVLGKACEVIDETDSDGQYSVALSTCEGPYLLRAENETATIHSIASSSDFGKNVSITPITELIAGRVLGTTNLGVIDKDEIQAKNISASDIVAKKNEIKKILVDSKILSAENGLNNFDLINSSFTPNGSGFDKILDGIDISPKDSTSFSFKIKGSDLDVDFAMTGETVADSATVAMIELEASNISIAGDYLNEIRARLTSFSNMLKVVSPEEKESSSLAYFHPEFTHAGMNSSDAYEKLIKFYSYIDLLNPVLLNIDTETDPSSPVADIFMEVKEYELEDEVVKQSGSYKNYMRLKKVGDDWYFYGDQMPVEVEVMPLNLNLNNNIHKGFLIDLDAKQSQIDLEISAGDFFTTDVIMPLLAPFGTIQNPSYKIGCTENTEYCQSFLKISDTVSLPNFLKVEVTFKDLINPNNDITYYTYTTTPKDVSSSSFPSFTDIPSDGMCGTFESTSVYPPALGFTIPEDHLGLEYIQAESSLAGGLSHDFWNGNDYEQSGLFVTNQFRDGSYSSYTGPIEVNKFFIDMTSANAFGQYMRTIYSCGQ